MIALISFFVVFTGCSVVTTSNDEVKLRNRFKQKMDERTSFYDNLVKKAVAGNAQIANKNAEEYNLNLVDHV